MQNLFKNAILPMMVSGGVLLWGASAAVNGATFVDLGNAAGAQCFTGGVNDSGQSVGNCAPTNPSKNYKPWYSASPAGPQQVLPALVTNRPCSVGGIANNGSMIGMCVGEDSLNFAVTWNATTPSAAPTKLRPLPSTLLIPLLRPADKQTLATAQNQQGAVLALSISSKNTYTAVLYMPGSATPTRISDWDDMCGGTVVNNTLLNGYPSILINCPVNGKNVTKIAIRGSSGYAFTELPVPSGASHCWGGGMNDQNQVVGTCLYSAPLVDDITNTAFWASPTNTPQLLILPGNANNAGVALNNAGHVLARGQDPDGNIRDYYWANPNSSQQVRPIALLTGGAGTVAFSLAENDTVAMDCTNATQHIIGCTWDPINTTQPIAPINGGLLSTLSSISHSGAYVAGMSTDAQDDRTAVVAELP